MNTIIFFVMILIGPAPNYFVIDSIVFKNNDETMIGCEETRAEILAEIRKNIAEMGAAKVYATPCEEMTFREGEDI